MKTYVGDLLKSKRVSQEKIDGVLSRITATGKGTRESSDDASDGSNPNNRVAEVNLTAVGGGVNTPEIMNNIGVRYGTVK